MSLYLPFFQVPSSLPVQQPFSACFLGPSPPFPRSFARAYTILRALAFLVPVSSTVLTLLLSFHYFRRASPVPHLSSKFQLLLLCQSNRPLALAFLVRAPRFLDRAGLLLSFLPLQAFLYPYLSLFFELPTPSSPVRRTNNKQQQQQQQQQQKQRPNFCQVRLCLADRG